MHNFLVKLKLIVLLLIVVLCSCNQANNGRSRGNHAVGKKSDIQKNTYEPVTGCYRQVTGRDTALLQLQQTGNKLTGKMRFDNYQKDSSHGTVTGSVEDDRISLWYHFFSEGMHSVLQIILKKNGDQLHRAIGNMQSSGDSAYFQPNSNLQFDPQQTFIKIPCLQQ